MLQMKKIKTTMVSLRVSKNCEREKFNFENREQCYVIIILHRLASLVSQLEKLHTPGFYNTIYLYVIREFVEYTCLLKPLDKENSLFFSLPLSQRSLAVSSLCVWLCMYVPHLLEFMGYF